MDPEKTDCHLISGEDKSPEELIQDIRQRTFRFQQKITISRYRYPKSVEYFSCDGKSGFLLAEKTDGTMEVFLDVKKEDWDELMNATDILETFSRSFTDKYPAYSGPE